LGYFIAGAIFIALSIAWHLIQRRAEVNEKHKEATTDGKKAIRDHNVAGLFKSIRDRMLNR
jgi:hypothetical protein